MNDNSEFKILSKAKYLIFYRDNYILSSFLRVNISLKTKWNVYKANINKENDKRYFNKKYIII